MYIAKNNDLIILAKETKEELEQALEFMVYDTIEETDVNYKLVGGVYVSEVEQAEIKQKEFENKFFYIPPIENIFEGGYFRKQPKGYSSAVESINTAFNAVTVMGLLPADYLIFYTKPDFTDETQCTEEWLIANQFKNNTMTAQEFGQFYVAFMTGWNNQEHIATEENVID